MDSTNDSTPQEWKAGPRELLIIVALVLVNFMSAFDSTVFPPALPMIAADLHGDATSTYWVGTAYLLPSASLQPFICSLSDRYGRRPLLLFSLALFTIGSIAGAAAQNMATLLAGRVIQGVGGGGLTPLPMIVTTDIFPLRQRPKYTSVVQIFAALGLIFGPLFGGLLSQYATHHGGWRWIFYINFPLCAGAFPAIFFTIRFQKKNQDQPTDWLGGFLFIASVVSVLLGLSWGGIEFPWTSFQTLLPLCLGAAGLVCTVTWELWGSSCPFLRPSILVSPSSLAAYAGAIVQGIMLFGILYYFALYLQAVRLFSPTITGLGILPMSGTMIPFSVITALLMSRFGKYKWGLWSGWSVTILGTGLLCLLDSQSSTGEWVGILIVLGLGHGMLFNSLLFAAQAVAPAKDVAYAASLYTFTRTLGFAVGVVIGSTALQQIMSNRLQDAGLPTDIAKNAAAYIPQVKALPENSERRQVIIDAYLHGVRGVFEILTGIGGVGLVSTLFLRQISMDQPLETNHELIPFNAGSTSSEEYRDSEG